MTFFNPVPGTPGTSHPVVLSTAEARTWLSTVWSWMRDRAEVASECPLPAGDCGCAATALFAADVYMSQARAALEASPV